MNNNDKPTPTEQLRNALPETLREDVAITEALQQVTNLETEHAQSTKRSQLERQFLERAPREGLLYPGDALKLEDVTKSLDTEDTGKALDKLYRDLKTRRPYLFNKPTQAPEKLAQRQPDHDRIREAWKGGLTRQVQITRDALRRR
jgi:hypothetical protein